MKGPDRALKLSDKGSSYLSFQIRDLISLHTCTELPVVGDWSLITGRGLQHGKGASEVLPQRKGGSEKVLSKLKGGPQKVLE